MKTAYAGGPKPSSSGKTYQEEWDKAAHIKWLESIPSGKGKCKSGTAVWRRNPYKGKGDGNVVWVGNPYVDCRSEQEVWVGNPYVDRRSEQKRHSYTERDILQEYDDNIGKQCDGDVGVSSKPSDIQTEYDESAESDSTPPWRR